jgi:hypothetical protein
LETPGRTRPTQYGTETHDASSTLPDDASSAIVDIPDAQAPAAEAGQMKPEAGAAPDGGPDAVGPLSDAAPLPDGAAPFDAASDAAAPAQDAAADAARGDAGSCTLDGKALAAEVFFDVNWKGTTLAGIVPLLMAGSGRIRVVVRLDLSGNGPRLRTRLTACEANMPDFAAGNVLVGTEQYAAYIPDAAWDESSMPRFDLGWDLGCNLPGCALSSDGLVATFGARANPGDKWPGRTGSISDIVPLDDDDDGYPGISFMSRDSHEHSASGTAYTEIPVTWTLASRCARAFIAFQVAGQFHGQLDSCDTLSGVVASGRVEARNFGCYAHAEGSSREYECASDEAEFLDENLPNWTVMGGSWRAQIVDSSFDCVDVRALFD